MAPDTEPRSFADQDAGERSPQMAAEPAEERSRDRKARMTPEEIDRALRDEHVSQR